MKLVQLLAKELKEWPEGAKHARQDFDGEICFVGGGIWSDFYASCVASDIYLEDGIGTSQITEDQWQAEREKMNKPKWIRHRGGKCPVAGGTEVETRHRDGKTYSPHFHTKNSRSGVAMNAVWEHKGDALDIMAYRVIEESKEQEIKEVKKTNFGTITYKLEIDATEATKEIDGLVAKWGQIESPLKWRDTIIHCQAIIEDCEREIERNVNLLDAEGLMMQKDSKKAMQNYQTDIDMSDWRNWQAGDIFEVVKKTDYFTVGNRYSVKYTANTDAPITATDDDGDEFCLFMEEIKFIGRP